MARPKWKLTVRAGPDVSHEEFEQLDEAVEVMRERAMGVRAAAGPKTAELLGTYKPADQVQARLQLTGPGRFRKPVAGIDVRGDGSFVPFRGAIRREELDPSGHETPFDLVRETLEEGRR